MANPKKFEVIKGKIGEVGSIAHLHYYEKGRSYIMEDRLKYCEPGKKYVSQALKELLETCGVNFSKSPKRVIKAHS
jgi:hypothetical protein